MVQAAGLDGGAEGEAAGDGVEADGAAGDSEAVTGDEKQKCVAQWRIEDLYFQRFPDGDVTIIRGEDSFLMSAPEASFLEAFVKGTTEMLSGAQWLDSYVKIMASAAGSEEEPREE